MIGYVTLGARDFEQALAFYDAVLGTLGWKRFAVHGSYAGYGPGGSADGQAVWVCEPFDGQPARAGNGIMIAFDAPDHDSVGAFHAAALAQGGSDEGAPGAREAYGPNWYAAYLRDPTGNKLAVVCNRAL